MTYITKNKYGMQFYSEPPKFKLHWMQDGDLAHILFESFKEEFEQTSDNVWKHRGTACKYLTPITIRGYSQGDLVTLKVASDWVDTEEKLSTIKTQYSRIFFDAPIFARLAIGDDEEFYIDDFYSDVYDTSRDALILAIDKALATESVSDIYKCALQEIKDNAGMLPDYAEFI